MKAKKLFTAVILTLVLGACSDESKVRSNIERSQPNADLFDFKSITSEEYAIAFDDFHKPVTAPRGRQVSASEFSQRPEFDDARYYSIKSRITNGYGNVVESIRYCSLIEERIDCLTTKSLTDIEDARKGAENG